MRLTMNKFASSTEGSSIGRAPVRKPGSAVKNIASSLLGRMADGLSKYRSNVPGTVRVFNMPEENGGSNPSPLTKFPKLTWGESIGLPECPYMCRWVLDFGSFAIRLHRWQASDDTRAFHDHAWWFLTGVISGSYVDVSPDGEDILTPGSIRFRKASHKHTVKILKPGTWTLLITGPVTRRWGFWVNGKLWKRDRYFAVNGHHPCDATRSPVRLRPDGTKI